eukprot:CAMPEP_0168553388 /NCGR_PEP_ID=MMETSP0413-20121227/7226_1 /TAXON_ID=136452 /ORGANISM="Filamoeba nolandi, Strain NC-AS-23-1" /LENGTH=106 /DNA_ID=CAMNT_0008584071 /DNA_START=748 /DNA_END=1068 /DNA_ORIENTATION=-
MSESFMSLRKKAKYVYGQFTAPNPDRKAITVTPTTPILLTPNSIKLERKSFGFSLADLSKFVPELLVIGNESPSFQNAYTKIVSQRIESMTPFFGEVPMDSKNKKN